MKTIYDVIVIGGGAAGMSAGIYSGRAKMKTLVLEQGSVGGQAKTTNEIVNYPGVRHTTGPKLMEEMHLQAEDFGVKFAQAEVLEAKLEGEIKRVNGKLSNQGFLAKAPESLVNEEKAKKAKFEEMMNSVLERIANIEAKMK